MKGDLSGCLEPINERRLKTTSAIISLVIKKCLPVLFSSAADCFALSHFDFDSLPQQRAAICNREAPASVKSLYKCLKPGTAVVGITLQAGACFLFNSFITIIQPNCSTLRAAAPQTHKRQKHVKCTLGNDLMARWEARVVDQDELAEVKLVGEAFAFGLVQDSLVVVVPG